MIYKKDERIINKNFKGNASPFTWHSITTPLNYGTPKQGLVELRVRVMGKVEILMTPFNFILMTHFNVILTKNLS